MKSTTSESEGSVLKHSDDWSEYWKHGSLTTFFGGEFEVGYSGDVASFWESCFSDLPTGARIVDLATGNGAIPFIALKVSARLDKKFSVLGVDYADIRLPSDPAVLSVMSDAQLLARRPMENTGIEADSVDLISSQYGFEYGSRDGTLDEVDRILKATGRLALVLHHPDSAVVEQAKREYRQTRLCINEERLDRKVRDLVKIVGDARTPEQRRKLKFNPDAEKRREQINRTMGRILRRVQGQNDAHIHQLSQSFLRVFADMAHLSMQEKLDFISKTSAEFLSYAGRMEAMSAATLSDTDYQALIDELERRNYIVDTQSQLRSPDDKLVARALRCHRPG